MSELTLLVLRIGFLLLLWTFVFGIVYALRTDLFGPRVRKPQQQSSNGAPATPPQPMRAATAPAPSRPATGGSSGTPPRATVDNTSRLVIVSGPKQGTELPLGREPITIGRSADSGLIIRDDYTSTHHARLMLWNDEWMVQDLDSTNGTFLAGKRVSVPTQIPLDTPVKVGQTSFELRR
ncbi:FHA domain-containing protein [Plantibacter sp. PA-3-X8]|uniref:Inner membrane component of T3SS domain-containing protein n=1 Tax=Plantibacter cousiniae (nom. nud.) TaxID=199709 RepID=A0ABY1LG47_9MICO|nr:MULTISPECIES: FHA domain-containing protein [Plantibacter]MBD8100986.1 FHA domain-containing protein [Plantibacter sp. CFBP 8775]AZH84834.1 FHA domain-containing protein [Plantibacter sp. PA-3-X8]TKK00288.1 FHA domain-containing protein [Plantibacter flavus]CAH0172856.1 FHA domain-containing protein FhaB [Plantibacter cousiniae]SKC36990.1 Inner membrane component of T3SS domain-containing protein [Plantibacter cousiniae]